jgi:hypothetical protein
MRRADVRFVCAVLATCAAAAACGDDADDDAAGDGTETATGTTTGTQTSTECGNAGCAAPSLCSEPPNPCSCGPCPPCQDWGNGLICSSEGCLAAPEDVPECAGGAGGMGGAGGVGGGQPGGNGGAGGT